MSRQNHVDERTTDYFVLHHQEESQYQRRHVGHLRKQDESRAGEEEQNEQSDGRTLRRLGDAKPPQKDNTPRGMARCSICKALVPKSRLEEHVEKSHTEKPDNPMERCPVCNVPVRADRLDKHIRKVHSE